MSDPLNNNWFHTMQISSPLKEVSRKFKLWDRNRYNKSQPIPHKLKELIIPLLNHYSSSELADHLHISKTTICAIKRSIEPSLVPKSAVANKEEDMNFIPFQLANIPQIADNHGQQNAHAYCEIIKSDGSKLIIQNSDTASIIKAFICSN